MTYILCLVSKHSCDYLGPELVSVIFQAFDVEQGQPRSASRPLTLTKLPASLLKPLLTLSNADARSIS